MQFVGSSDEESTERKLKVGERKFGEHGILKLKSHEGDKKAPKEYENAFEKDEKALGEDKKVPEEEKKMVSEGENWMCGILPKPILAAKKLPEKIRKTPPEVYMEQHRACEAEEKVPAALQRTFPFHFSIHPLTYRNHPPSHSSWSSMLMCWSKENDWGHGSDANWMNGDVGGTSAVYRCGERLEKLQRNGRSGVQSPAGAASHLQMNAERRVPSFAPIWMKRWVLSLEMNGEELQMETKRGSVQKLDGKLQASTKHTMKIKREKHSNLAKQPDSKQDTNLAKRT